MNRLHIIGRKNHGKTTLVVELIDQLTRRGLRVGSIKHTHHRHELDVPGKDSHRHRTAGAAVVGVLSKGLSAVYLPKVGTDGDADPYSALAASFAGCDLVLVEGDSKTTAPKIEVWRSAVGSPPLAVEDQQILAIVTDDATPLDAHTLPRSDTKPLVDWVVERFVDSGRR